MKQDLKSAFCSLRLINAIITVNCEKRPVFQLYYSDHSFHLHIAENYFCKTSSEKFPSSIAYSNNNPIIPATQGAHKGVYH